MYDAATGIGFGGWHLLKRSELLDEPGWSRDDLFKNVFAFKIRWNYNLILKNNVFSFILKWVKFILLNYNKETYISYVNMPSFLAFSMVILETQLYVIFLILPKWEPKSSFLCYQLICSSLFSSIVVIVITQLFRRQLLAFRRCPLGLIFI